MIVVILKLLYFMIPAYLANMAPPLAKNILKFMAVPIDRGKEWGGKPILGKNKTWRGIFVGTAVSTLAFLLQKYLYSFESFKAASMIDYSTATIWIGVLLGFGALFGDSVESFFKRRIGIKSGKPWIPFDQTDFTIGALLLTSIVYFPGWANAAIIVIVSAFGHVLINRIGYHLKLRDVKL
ncbi:CDP-archaeol synthase [Candidatus Woesearchaeota archaeon]|nr:CDP-archaeol synthase [Candidatus Woesearchaeota archaeon]